MKIMLTGASGRTGHDLISYFLARHSSWQILALYRDPDKLSPLKKLVARYNASARVEFLRHDIALPLKGNDISNDRPIDCIIHGAAMRPAAPCELYYDKAIDANITGTMNMIRFCLEKNIPKFIFFSVQAVYDAQAEAPIREETPLDADDLYTISKIAAEMIVKARLRSSGNFYILRLPHIYGFSDCLHDGIIQAYAESTQKGQLIIHGSGNQTSCFIHILDLSTLVERLLVGKDIPSGIYNAASETLSVKTIAAYFGELSEKKIGRKPEYVHLKESDGNTKIRNFGLNIEKIIRASGWLPQHKLKDYIVSAFG